MTQRAPETSVNDLPITFTLFPSVQDKRGGRLTRTWHEIGEVLANPKETASKSECRLLKLATFGAASGRSDGVDKAYGLEGDYDQEEVSIEEACRRLRLAGIAALAYTTASHTAQRPRWRVLAPLATPCGPDERHRLVGVLNSVLGGVLSPESFTAGQLFYFGRVSGAPYECHRIEGRAIDEVENLPDPVYPERMPAPSGSTRHGAAYDLVRDVALGEVSASTLADLRSALKAIPADDRDLWVRMGQALASLRRTPFADEARELWIDWSATSNAHDPDNDPDQWETFAGSRSDYRAVFAEAQRRGWINPRAKSAPPSADEYEKLEDRTDAGNANTLVRLTRGDLRFVPERELWLHWDGVRWMQDIDRVAVQQVALLVAKSYIEKADELLERSKDTSLSDSDRKKLVDTSKSIRGWGQHCRNKRGIDSMLALASRHASVVLPFDRLDRDPWLLGVENGVIDLRTGVLRADARDEFVTKRVPLKFNARAMAPHWLKFIEEITARGLPAERDVLSGQVKPETIGRYTPRLELAIYLQRALGYSITGSTREHKMFLAVGPGANGKSVLLDTFQQVAGPYCHTVAPEALMSTRFDVDAERPSPTMAGLAGVRAAMSCESKAGHRLDVALIKRQTGGGYLTARLMRENVMRFEITHKLWLMTNNVSSLDHLDDATKGRLHVIPFDRVWNRPGHSDRDPELPDGDKELVEKLRGEFEGILAWLVAGAVDYAREGLDPPALVESVTREFFLGQDDVGRWLESHSSPRQGSTS